jgi:hypothetical protein
MAAAAKYGSSIGFLPHPDTIDWPTLGAAGNRRYPREEITMSMSLRLLVVGAALAMTGAAFAGSPAASNTAPAAKTRTAQQQRMADCNQQATGKKGADRKTFMSSCLKGATMAGAPSASQTQQEKMKSCNADAKTKALKGADRKTFMSGCLKGGSAAAHS